MSDVTVPVQGSSTVTVAAAALIATFSSQQYQVIQLVGYPNEPNQPLVLFQGVGYYTSSVFANGATITVNAGSAVASYNTGVSSVVGLISGNPTQGNPGALNATGTLTAALIYTRIVTSTTAAAVVATLDTGTVMDASATWAIGDSFQWVVINTGASNAFTVTATTGHTIVGSGIVALTSSATFRTRKTAANTFITYRIGS